MQGSFYLVGRFESLAPRKSILSYNYCTL